MSAIERAANPVILTPMSGFVELNESSFFARFGNYDTAKLIGSDEHEKSDEESITSFDMAECITLFAIEKRGSQIEAIIGWHISDDTSVDTIKGEDFLDAHLFGKSSESEGPEDSRGKKYDLYIVGGDETTTQGHGCLLENIHQAIEEFFFEDSFIIRQKYVHLNLGTGIKFVSANLQMDGTLTICRHNNRHG